MNAGSLHRRLGLLTEVAPDAADGARKRRRPDMERVRSRAAVPSGGGTALTAAQRELFHALYRDHFDFVFRNLRRLGVPASSIDDALQEVYLVVLRRLDEYREGSQPKAWLFAIALRVAGNQRRAQRRRGEVVPLFEANAPSKSPSPFECAARAEAGRVLHDFLAELDEPKRAVFVMAELEQMSAPEIASALSMNLNTVYSRLQAARAEFARTASRHARRFQGTYGQRGGRDG
jgi:RNA polymerase sigma-70 factor, ECF subfamily